MADKNKVIIEYLMTCDAIKNSALYFNFAKGENNSKYFITLSQEKRMNQSYVDGTQKKKYSLTIISSMFINKVPLINTLEATTKENKNVSTMAQVQALIDWITEQNELKVFPDFGDDCIVESIKTTTENPNIDRIDATVEPPLAQYSITIEVEYIDTSKAIWK